MPKEPSREEVAQFIVAEAKRIDYPDTLLALSIAKAESGFRQICNLKDCRYGIGVFQIVRSTFRQAACAGDVFNTEDNIRCGLKLLKEDGHGHWDMSVSGWLPIYKELVIAQSRIKWAEWEAAQKS